MAEESAAGWTEVYKKTVENWKISDWISYIHAKRDASGKMKSVERMCAKIELLRNFKIFHSQCNYLVHVISKFTPHVKNLNSLTSKYEVYMVALYASNKLSQLISSLDSLLRDLMSAEKLLQACRGKNWKRAALVLSMPPPEMGKYTGSRFLLLLRDFSWSLEVVLHSFRVPPPGYWPSAIQQSLSTEELMKMKSSGQSGDEWKFKWCHRRCRYKLETNVQASEREDETKVASEARSHEDDVDQQASDCKDVTGVAVDKEEPLQADFDRQAQDRENLPGIVEEYLASRAHGCSFFHSLRQLSWNAMFANETSTNKFLAVVKNRCQNATGSGSTNLVFKCFEIDYLDLKIKNQISSGASKRISRAHWLGQEVAIAVFQHIPRDVVEEEAGLLVKVHHPNVVDFFGFALKEEALTEEEMVSAEKIEPKWTGYLVMELMQEDLRSLIEKLLRGPQKQEHGGPFSLSIAVDILLQIVGAMIHSHKFDILHRDLKAKNCLVNPKPVFSSLSAERVPRLSPQYYTVKLIDFGESKLWAKAGKQTLKKGTVRWMAPEVWQSSEYSKSADVYSFGMTCYEVVTGLIPFQGVRERVMDEVLAGVRPTIPVSCPQGFSALMTKCWAHKPEDRPTFEEIHKDMWAIKYSVDVPRQF